MDSKKLRSALSNIIAGSLPPNSIQHGLRFFDAAEATFFPTNSDPMKVIWSISFDVVNVSTTSG